MNLMISRHRLVPSCEPNRLQEFQKCCGVEKAVSVYVLNVNKEL